MLDENVLPAADQPESRAVGQPPFKRGNLGQKRKPRAGLYRPQGFCSAALVDGPGRYRPQCFCSAALVDGYSNVNYVLSLALSGQNTLAGIMASLWHRVMRPFH
eukprot:1159579-Pelagomonas_calceolata.AAC.9